ncbi:MAG: DHH family phosphoesterase [Lachnospiraceae bacterium]|nr:DHH family phosphoesterase [Lachnospiraceae bacterium]
MPLTLAALTKYDDIVIQCHDNPDADALASGMALHYYLTRQGKHPRFIYGGRNKVSKSNLLLMIEHLSIPVSHVAAPEPGFEPELLITVDCQYGESNVTAFPARNIAVIDHHQVSGELPKMSEVRSNYGACATVMYELLAKEQIDINEDEDLATALYYGLMTDTSGFAEISHPADKDLRDFAKFKLSDIILFKNSNISREELKIAGDALKHAHFHEDGSYAIVEAKPCDPNILGLISDMLLEVDSVDTCLVYSMLSFGVKISVRSCVKETKASELASYLTTGLGGGGGHLVKAGGILKKDLLVQSGVEYTGAAIAGLMEERMKRYYEESEIIYAGQHHEDIETLNHYRKKDLNIGYVEASDLASDGTVITIRTLEGDVDMAIRPDLMIMLGIDGEIYPTNREKFMAGNVPLDADYVFPGEYEPVVVDISTGERIGLLPHAHACRALGGAGIYARQLDHRVKVFTSWDTEKYYLGTPGDFLVVRADDTSDVYIVEKSVFERSYELTV